MKRSKIGLLALSLVLISSFSIIFLTNVESGDAQPLHTDIVVDDDWSGQSDVPAGYEWNENAFNSIQDAVDKAMSSALIRVYPGTYNESIMVDVLDLTLESTSGPESTIVSTDNPDDSALYISADNVTVDGFTFRDVTLGVPDAGIYLDGSDNCRVVNSIFENNKRGINLFPPEEDILYSNVIENNLFEHNINAIVLQDAVDTEIRKNVIRDIIGDGMSLNHTYGTLIENNFLENINANEGAINEAAIGLYESTPVGIVNNQIRDSRLFGISWNGCYPGPAENSRFVGITGNLIDNCELDDIHLESITESEEENIIPIVMFNEIKNGNRGINVWDELAELWMFRYNNFTGNNTGIKSGEGESLNATYNWWGATNGPGGDGPGDGDDVSGDVLYDPWLPGPMDRMGLQDWAISFFDEGHNEIENLNIEVDFDSSDNGYANISLMNQPGWGTPPGSSVSALYFDISTNPDNITENAWVTVHYTDDDVEGIREEDLKIYHWNAETSSWELLQDIVVDVENNTITGYASHLSPFALFGPEPEPEPEPEPASFEVSELSIDPEEVEPGETVNISAKVKNVGEVQGSYTAVLKIEGGTVDSETVTLEGGESTTVSFEITRSNPQVYGVEIDNLLGSFKVLKPAEFQLSGLIIEPSSPRSGDEVTISCSVRNVGEIRGTHYLSLKANNKRIDAESVTLEPRESRKVEFTMDGLMPGKTYQISVDGLRGQFTVQSVAGQRRISLTKEEPETHDKALIPIIISIVVIITMATLIYTRNRKE